MSETKKWPKWLKITYFHDSHSTAQSYNGSVSDMKMLFDVFERLDLKMENIIAFRVNDQIIQDSELLQMFSLLERYRKEKERNEKR